MRKYRKGASAHGTHGDWATPVMPKNDLSPTADRASHLNEISHLHNVAGGPKNG